MPKASLERPHPPVSHHATTRASGKRPLDSRLGRPSQASGHERSPPPDLPAPPGAVPHPTRRGECLMGPRPCPLVGCLYNNYLDVREDGVMKLAHPDRLPENVPTRESCALDMADRGPHTLDEVAAVLGLTRERIRQIEVRAVEKLCAALQKLDPMLSILNQKSLLTLHSRRAKMIP